MFTNDLDLDGLIRLAEDGGDWDRRNRIKVYRGLYLLAVRNFKLGAELLLDTLSTFAATEILNFEEFITLCIISGVLTLERKDYKKKVRNDSFILSNRKLLDFRYVQIINAPEVIAALPQLPHLKEFSTSLYNCEYSTFFKSLAEIEKLYLLPNLWLNQHTKFYIKEMRIKAYTQLLESYRSVTMKNLCNSFGVNEDWLDA